MNLRNAVLENLNKSSSEDVFKTISDAISSKEEQILPGLGVIFELFWNHLNDVDKKNICNNISNLLQK